ncbi:MAG: phytanoyl-CoA dioxygenase [Planctomycetaceae bacterium]|nr:phytanoyl-CoA dioxygenase [Planctomycetaceae bacterium]
MTLAEALIELGVHDDTLTSAERASLDRDGFLYLHDVFTPEQGERMLAERNRLVKLEKTGDGGPLHYLEQMQNKSDAFDVCLMCPRLLSAVNQVLRGDFVWQGVHSQRNMPGGGQAALHQDGECTAAGQYITCNSMWPLVDFTETNGATRVVPGSHLWGKGPADVMDDPAATHPDEKVLVARVGTVVVFNGNTWHNSTLNQIDTERYALTSFWARPPHSFFDTTPSDEARARFGEAALRLMPSSSDEINPVFPRRPA